MKGEAVRAGADVLVSMETIARIGDLMTGRVRVWHDAHPDQIGPGKAELLRAAAVKPMSPSRCWMCCVRAVVWCGKAAPRTPGQL